MLRKPPYRFYYDGDVTIGSRRELLPSELDEIMKLLVECDNTQPINHPTLKGRGSIIYGRSKTLGELAVKGYTRGGILRRFVERSYLRFGITRGQLELETLYFVRELGVNAPEPIAFAHKGSIIYKAWLIMKRINEESSFADLALKDEDVIRSLAPNLISQLNILIRNRIFHVDLHPGNVIVDSARRVFIIDFDKAIPFKGKIDKLRDHYLRRWRRAVIKHRLPDLLSEIVFAGLRESFEDKM